MVRGTRSRSQDNELNGLSRCHILLVEDDQPTCRVMSRLLQCVDVQVQLRIHIKGSIRRSCMFPALVVLDLILPDGRGTELLRAIRTLHLPCKVAVLSGAADPAMFTAVQELRPDVIFGKPLDFEDFVEWLGEAFPEHARIAA